MDGGIITAATTGNVSAGDVTVKTLSPLLMSECALISSSTQGSGSAGNITVNAPSLSLDNSTITAETSGIGGAGTVTVNAAQTLSEANGSSINSSTSGSGNAGSVKVDSPVISLDNSFITAETRGLGAAGSVNVSSAILALINDASIAAKADANSGGKTGDVAVSASGSINIASGGQISIENQGNAINPTLFILGQLTVSAPLIALDNGSITASTGGNVNAGAVTVNAAQTLSEANGSSINAFTSGLGNAGSVKVDAPSISLDNSAITAETRGLGAAGSVNVSSTTLALINNASIAAKADANSGGQTGGVAVSASGSINIAHGGNISIESQGTAANPASLIPGQLTVSAPVIALDNGSVTASTSGNVNAGTVAVDASQTLSETNGSSINSSTSGPGNAGRVKVDSPVISLDNSTITAETSGLGAAGSVNVSSTTLSLINNASIAAKADANSGGQTGNVAVNASRSIAMDNSNISIQNLGFAPDPKAITPGLLYVSAPDITLRGSSITSQSTQNVDASPIQIHFTHSLSLDPSFISTEAQNGNGGSITIQGGDILRLANSGIRTSVLGQNGNGGNISVTVNRLVMETGLIQANTAAKGANGGTVFLNVETLLPSGSMLIFGGNEPVNWDIHSNEFGWNVIQAAAPGGISGVINLTSPQLNLNGVLSNFGNAKFYSETLNQDICSMGTGSSLVRRGKGGMPVKSSDSLLFY